jgi:hypothetical protein
MRIFQVCFTLMICVQINQTAIQWSWCNLFTNVHTHTYRVYDATDQVQRLSNLFPTWITFMICVHTPNHNPHNLNATLYWYTDASSVQCNRSVTDTEKSLPITDCIHDPSQHQTTILEILTENYSATLIRQACDATDQIQMLRNLFQTDIAIMICVRTRPWSLKSWYNIRLIYTDTSSMRQCNSWTYKVSIHI